VEGAGRPQAERTLTAEQRKADFRPPEDGPPPPLDRPTGACELVAALLGALLRISATHLQGSNLAAFDAEARRPRRAEQRDAGRRLVSWQVGLPSWWLPQRCCQRVWGVHLRRAAPAVGATGEYSLRLGFRQHPRRACWAACLQGSRARVQGARRAHTQAHVHMLVLITGRNTRVEGPRTAPLRPGVGLRSAAARARGAGGPARARAAAGAHAAVQLQRDGRAALEARHHRVRGRAAHRALAAHRGAGARPARLPLNLP